MSINLFPAYPTNSKCETKLFGKPVYSSESATESITLDEIKDHLYIDLGNSTFDTILTALRKECRQYIEEITALSLISRTITAHFNYASEFRIPFGPVTSFTSAEIKTGIGTYETKTSNSDYEIIGDVFVSYSGNYLMRLIYVGGYTAATIPHGLKMAVLNEISRRFNNRGDGVIPTSNDLLDSYKMLEWLM